MRLHTPAVLLLFVLLPPGRAGGQQLSAADRAQLVAMVWSDARSSAAAWPSPRADWDSALGATLRAAAAGPALLPPPGPPTRAARRRAGARPAPAGPALTGGAPPAARHERGAPAVRARLRRERRDAGGAPRAPRRNRRGPGDSCRGVDRRLDRPGDRGRHARGTLGAGGRSDARRREGNRPAPPAPRSRRRAARPERHAQRV